MNSEALVDERRIPRRALVDLLQELETSDQSRVTLSLPPRSLPPTEPDQEFRDWLEIHQSVLQRPRNGAALYWSPAESYLIEPPLPFKESSRLEGWRTENLLSQFSGRFRLGVILLRLGGFAVGIFDGDDLVASKVGRRFVKNRHRKGGQSQRRYDRIREKQTYEHFGKLCEIVQTQLMPQLTSIDYIIRGGDERTMDEFAKQCSLMKELESKFIPRFLTVPEPRQDVLESIPREIWQCRLWQITGP